LGRERVTAPEFRVCAVKAPEPILAAIAVGGVPRNVKVTVVASPATPPELPVLPVPPPHPAMQTKREKRAHVRTKDINFASSISH
jgi:hypothetical protein